MKKILLIFTLIFSFSKAYGNILKGKVMDENSNPLPFVSIIIEKTTNGTQSDLDGNFILNLPDSSVNVVFFSVGFEENKILTNGGEIKVVLKSKVLNINEIEISAKKNNSSENILLLERKNSNTIESNIGSAELSKKGISNIEDGLKKIVGITFQNNRINFRGLDDRYNQITLNGIPIPSNNSDKKNIDLNLLPVGMSDNISVRKSYSSDQWSNIAASQIDINSLDIYDRKSISLRSGFNTNTPYLNSGFNLQFGKTKIKKFGFLFNLNLVNDIQNTKGIIRLINKQGDKFLDYKFEEYFRSTTPSGLAILNYDNKNLSLSNNFIFVNQNTESYRQTFGNHFDYSSQLFTTRLTPIKNNLINNQFSATYNINKWEFKSVLNFSKTNSGEINRRQFVYLYDGNYQFNNIDKLDNHIFSNNSNENRFNAGLNVSFKNKNIVQKFGLFYLISNNYFNYNQTYFDLDNINNTYQNIDPNNPEYYLSNGNYTELTIKDPASKVFNTNQINGLFYRIDNTFKKVNLSSGFRIENVYQLTTYRDQTSPLFERNSLLQNLDFLPFVNFKLNVNEKLNIKSNISKTTIRPRFRELVPFMYTEIFAGSKIQGNPNLLNSQIYNLDLGIDYFPKNNEIISTSLFYKRIINPIEKVNVATASGRLETFQNSEASDVMGVELEIKKKLGKFSLDFNTSLLRSKILISNDLNSTVVVTNLKRDLQGSTPLLANFDLFYEVNKDNNFGFTYNFIGSKLISVGIFGLGDIYQKPQNFLNFIYNKKIKKADLSIRVNNILNTPFEFTQSYDYGTETVNFYELGRDFSVSLRFNF